MTNAFLALEKDGRPTGLGVLAWMVVAVMGFNLAYAVPATSPLILVYLFALTQLARADRWRLAFYPGLGVGLMIAGMHLTFFWNLFSFGAAALWLVFAIWIGFFTVLARLAVNRFGRGGWVLVPVIWMGLEYYRSELYFLRFSWLSPGYAFAWLPAPALGGVGVYGLGFLLMAMACLAGFIWARSKVKAGAVLAAEMGLLFVLTQVPGASPTPRGGEDVRIAGVQMEFPAENEVLVRLTELIRRYPETQLIVLSEYTFDGPVPERIRNWCRKNAVHLIVGGKDPAPGGGFYNTAFVISPAGEIVFRQVKTVPIQFFKDGLPATAQRVWESPWGKLGICICYDLSYSRVTDELIRQGAQALIVPTMDVADWGRRQHELHGRIAPARAAEYGVPIFRLASSGISQNVDNRGGISAQAPFGGDGAVLRGELRLGSAGRLPPDRFLVPPATGATILLAGYFFLGAIRKAAGGGKQGLEKKTTGHEGGNTEREHKHEVA